MEIDDIGTVLDERNGDPIAKASSPEQPAQQDERNNSAGRDIVGSWKRASRAS